MLLITLPVLFSCFLQEVPGHCDSPSPTVIPLLGVTVLAEGGGHWAGRTTRKPEEKWLQYFFSFLFCFFLCLFVFMVEKPSKAAGELVGEAVPGRHRCCIVASLHP